MINLEKTKKFDKYIIFTTSFQLNLTVICNCKKTRKFENIAKNLKQYIIKNSKSKTYVYAKMK